MARNSISFPLFIKKIQIQLKRGKCQLKFSRIFCTGIETEILLNETKVVLVVFFILKGQHR